MPLLFEGIVHSVVDLLVLFVAVGFFSMCGGVAFAVGLRIRGLRWTWSVVAVFPALLLSYVSLIASIAGVSVCLMGSMVGLVCQSRDLMAGGDYAEAARNSLGVIEAVQRLATLWQEHNRPRGWLHDGRLEIGCDERGERVYVPVGGRSGSHALVLGATGSGKTCGEAWIAGRLIERGHAVVAIDPKGDTTLRSELEWAAQRAGTPFLAWTPEGPLSYNPFSHGSDTEIADKALAGELFTEPHYLRQAQRYLGHTVRAMHAANATINAASLMAHMNPDMLEETARSLPKEKQATKVLEYLDSLNDRQRRDLAGVRDRLSILAESDIAPWLCPTTDEQTLQLDRAIRCKAVVYFLLQADRRPLLAKMLGGALIADLTTIAADLQAEPTECLVLIDEFSALASEHVSRLFGRARSAGISLLLATQELADLKAAGQDALRDQVLGNIEATIAYRQNVPDSAELIAAFAGTEPTWITTQQTQTGLLGNRLSGLGTRRRGHEYTIHPSRIKQLRTGQAVVIAPASNQRPTVALIHHPNEARR